MVESPNSNSHTLAFEASSNILHEPEKLPKHPHPYQQEQQSNLNNGSPLLEQQATYLIEQESSFEKTESPSLCESHVTINTTLTSTTALTQPADRSVPDFSRANPSHSLTANTFGVAATTATRQNKQPAEEGKANKAAVARSFATLIAPVAATTSATVAPAAASLTCSEQVPLVDSTQTDDYCRQQVSASSSSSAISCQTTTSSNTASDVQSSSSDLNKVNDFSDDCDCSVTETYSYNHTTNENKQKNLLTFNNNEQDQLNDLLYGTKKDNSVNIAPNHFDYALLRQQLQQVDYDVQNLSSSFHKLTDIEPPIARGLASLEESADQYLNLSSLESQDNEKEGSYTNLGASHSKTTDEKEENTTATNEKKGSGFNLRALSDSISALENNPWVSTHELTQDLSATVLSTELVNETLNYFVNCRQRSSQMTKTYDDNDAYILLLQEKEVDLELAARIGQDLLKQNNQLKDSLKSLKEELAQRQDDVQQLKYELASKISLLDTFIEEEEHQTSSNKKHQSNDDDDSKYQQQQQHIDQDYSDKKGSTSTVIHYATATQNSNQNGDLEDDLNRGFSSLTYNNQLKNTTNGEPFSSLPFLSSDGNYLNNDTLSRDNSNYNFNSDPNSSGLLNKSSTNCERQKLVENVTLQLVESNKRLCELQDELLYKGEQNITQQEKIYSLQEQLRESEHRLECISIENETLRRSIEQSEENQRELIEEVRSSKRNLNELLSAFLELQKETRLQQIQLQQQQQGRNSQCTTHSGGVFFSDRELAIEDLHNISFDSFNTTNLSLMETQTGTTLAEATSGIRGKSSVTANGTCSDSGTWSSDRQRNHLDEDDDVDVESEDGNSEEGCDSSNFQPAEKNWSTGLSSFMLCTILLLCLSVTFNGSTNSNLASKFQFKLDP